MQNKEYYVYMLACKKYGTLYIGVTGNIIRRIYEHKENLLDGFTKKYSVHKLVYYETYGEIADAISREKEIKVWRRDWKINLIESENPQWIDLYYEIIK